MADTNEDFFDLGQIPVKDKRASRPRIPSVEEVEKKEEAKWTVFSASQNLAAALNDPMRREMDLFTRTWGSYFVPTAPIPSAPCSVPKIELGDFLRYLKETSAGRKVHRGVVRQMKKAQLAAASSPVLPVVPVKTQLEQDGRMYDLDSIPRIFMQEDFSLEDPSTFTEVLPLAQLLNSPRTKQKQQEGKSEQATKSKDQEKPSRKTFYAPLMKQDTRNSFKLLHEKLTHYLDIIEVHLAYQISKKSDMFFSTLSSQQELQTHIMQVRHEVVELRHKLRQLDAVSCHEGLKLMRLCMFRSHCKVVHQKLKLISTVQQTQPTIQLLLSTSDFVGALDLITTTQEVLQQELQGVHSLRHLGSQLAELEKMIERMMAADLVHFALEDIQQRLLSSGDSLAPDGTDSEAKLLSVVYGLLRQGKLHFLTALREELLTFLRSQVRAILSSFLKVPDVEGEGDETLSLADCMRGLEFEPWMGLLEHVFEEMLRYLSSVQCSLKVIARVCVKAAGKTSANQLHNAVGSRGVSVSSEHDSEAVSSPIAFSAGVTRPPGSTETEWSRLEEPGARHHTTSANAMESFEASTAAQEAEDRLEQLFLEDELSDLTLGFAELDSTPNSFQIGGPTVEGSTSIISRSTSLSVPGPSALTRGGASSQSSAHLGSIQGGGDSTGAKPTTIVGGESLKKRTGSLPAIHAIRNDSAAAPRHQLSDLAEGTDSQAVVKPKSEAQRREPSRSGAMNPTLSSSSSLPTHQEFTLDSSELERLEDSMAVAGVDDSAIISSAECHQLLMECHEVMCASCDLVHARCAKILVIRAKAGLLENVVSSDFVLLVRLVESFVTQSAKITGQHCPNLRSALLTQAKKFLEHFHETKRVKLGLLLDGERWRQADVPAEVQTLVHRLETGIALPVSGGGSRSLSPETSHHPPGKTLLINGQSFAVVSIVLILVKVIMEYCQCADDLPMLIIEVMSKLIETLKFVNSRMYQLVLGAGAVEAVGLKTITARHLALVTRCLQAIMLLIPSVRLHFQQRLAPKQHILLTQLDQVTEDFGCHCRQINSKVKTIMDDLILKQLSKWEAKSPIPSPGFKTLIKQIVKLHENLIDILPPDQLQALFTSIESSFRNRLRMQLIKLGITNNGSTQHGIVNSELSHFKGALSSLENITAFGSTLFDVWTVSR